MTKTVEAIADCLVEDHIALMKECEALRNKLWHYEHGTSAMCANAAIGAAEEWQKEVELLRAENARLKNDKDGAYLERNKLVALLAKLCPSGIKRTAIDGWSDDWHGCVFIDFPWGQASWHYHDSQAHLFEGLPPYQGEWDGHTTDEKYAAIDAALGDQP
jgi:hypothetical protein